MPGMPVLHGQRVGLLRKVRTGIEGGMMAELEGHDGHDSYAFAQLRACQRDLLEAAKRIHELEGQLDAMTELATDAVRELEDEPHGAWFAKRLQALGGGYGKAD